MRVAFPSIAVSSRPNPAFGREAGVNLRGKWASEFAPELEKFWFETYGRGLDGRACRFRKLR
jgi:hypothetical protein